MTLPNAHQAGIQGLHNPALGKVERVSPLKSEGMAATAAGLGSGPPKLVYKGATLSRCPQRESFLTFPSLLPSPQVLDLLLVLLLAGLLLQKIGGYSSRA